MKFVEVQEAFASSAVDVVERSLGSSDDFVFDIDPEDEMFYQAVAKAYPNNLDMAYFKYIESGKRTLDVVRQMAQQLYGGWEGVPLYLEFACGHGRFTRHLVHELPPERVNASDIYPSAVQWHKEILGVDGFCSAEDPDDIQEERRYRMIVAGSLFSHLPDGLFQRWLVKLHSMLDDKGVVVLSLHSDRQMPDHQSMEGKDFQYYTFSESRSLTDKVYGQTFVTDAYMERVIGEVVGSDKPNFKLLKKTFYENQDVYVVPKDQSMDLSGLKPLITPMGGRSSLDASNYPKVSVEGWAIDLNEGEDIERIELWLDGELFQTAVPHEKQPDKLKFFKGSPNLPVGWRFDIDVPPEVTLAGSVSAIFKLVSSCGATADIYTHR